MGDNSIIANEIIIGPPSRRPTKIISCRRPSIITGGGGHLFPDGDQA